MKALHPAELELLRAVLALPEGSEDLFRRLLYTCSDQKEDLARLEATAMLAIWSVFCPAHGDAFVEAYEGVRVARHLHAGHHDGDRRDDCPFCDGTLSIERRGAPAADPSAATREMDDRLLERLGDAVRAYASSQTTSDRSGMVQALADLLHRDPDMGIVREILALSAAGELLFRSELRHDADRRELGRAATRDDVRAVDRIMHRVHAMSSSARVTLAALYDILRTVRLEHERHTGAAHTRASCVFCSLVNDGTEP